jgi:hypothetical protein
MIRRIGIKLKEFWKFLEFLEEQRMKSMIFSGRGWG